MRNSLTRDEERAVQDPEAARAVVVSLKKESATLRKSLKDSQDRVESWRSKSETISADNQVLKSKSDFFVGCEVVKFLCVIGVGIGAAYLPGSMLQGVIWTAISGAGYIGVTLYEKYFLSKKN